MSQVFNIPIGDSTPRNYPIQVIKLLPNDRAWTVTIEPTKKRRSTGQNSMQWVALLSDFSNQVIIDGKQFSTAIWHEFLKERFLPETDLEGETLKNYCKWQAMPDGKLKMVGSTTKLTKLGFSNYMERCYAYGAGELDIRFTANPRDYL